MQWCNSILVWIFQRQNTNLSMNIAQLSSISLEHDDWSVKAIGKRLQVDDGLMALIPATQRSYTDDWKNSFLNKSKCVINQQKELAAWMWWVTKLAYIFLLHLSFPQFEQSANQNTASHPWNTHFWICKITQGMALLFSKLVPGNCLSYCSLTLLHDIVKR